MAYIGLDLGSTYTKIALLENGQVKRERQLASPSPLSNTPDRYEVDAEAYFAHVLSLLRDYESEGREGILISTQMHGYVLTDTAFRPLTPYVSWQDKIGARHLEEFRQVLTAQDVAPSGVPLKANLALCSLWERMREGFSLPVNAVLQTLGGYMIARLTGAFACHMTNAAPTGLADVQNGQWNRFLAEKAGMGKLILPDIYTDIVPVGTWRGIPVYPDLGDQQVCAAGADLSIDDALHVSVGTAGLIGALNTRWVNGRYENRPWLLPGMYLRTVSGLPGGRDIAALHKQIHRALGAAVSEDEVWHFMTVPDESSLALNAELVNSVTAFYTQMAQAYRQAADQLDIRITKLAFSGGAANRNPLLRSCLQTAFQANVCTNDHDVMKGFLAIIARLEDNL